MTNSGHPIRTVKRVVIVSFVLIWAGLLAMWPVSHRYTSLGIDLESPAADGRVRCTFYRLRWPGDGSVCLARLVESRAATAKPLERFDLGGRFFKPAKAVCPANGWNRAGFWYVTRPGTPQAAADGMAPGASEVFLMGAPHWLAVVISAVCWTAIGIGSKMELRHRPKVNRDGHGGRQSQD